MSVRCWLAAHSSARRHSRLERRRASRATSVSGSCRACAARTAARYFWRLFMRSWSRPRFRPRHDSPASCVCLSQWSSSTVPTAPQLASNPYRTLISSRTRWVSARSSRCHHNLALCLRSSAVRLGISLSVASALNLTPRSGTLQLSWAAWHSKGGANNDTPPSPSLATAHGLRGCSVSSKPSLQSLPSPEQEARYSVVGPGAAVWAAAQHPTAPNARPPNSTARKSPFTSDVRHKPTEGTSTTPARSAASISRSCAARRGW
mmetsp:Transcript_63728/g.176753  ORF Transcript_63728/g.176753 Transcript_63728/m.176753 type:complete len:262 (-) Transcript_63728:69-854(-)